jgi:oligopeptide transport system substrate-binding protein
MHRRIRAFICGVFVVVLITSSLPLGGAIRPAAATGPAKDTVPATLRVAMPAPGSVDPTQLSRFEPHTRDLAENLFVGLTRFNPDTQQIEPMLAKDWTISDDGLVWTFTLRDDMQWVRYDSTTQEVVAVRPVAAGDFVYAVQRACDPTRPSPVTPNLMIIQGCHAIANAFPEVITDLLIAKEIGVRATGPNILEIRLQYPAAYFPSLLSTPEFRPLPREAVTAADNWTQAQTIMTSGPFALQSWQPTGMTLTRNPFWSDGYAGNVEQVEVVFSSDTFTPVTLISTSAADFARLDAVDIASARAALPELLHTAEGSTLTLIGFSPDRAMVELTEVRRALSFALDREALAEQFFPGVEQAATQVTPSNVVAAPQLGSALYDPVQAQSYLTTAGFANCADVPEKLILLVPEEDPIWAEVGNAIIQQWITLFGCNPALFEVKTIERTLLIDLMHSTYDPEKVTRSHMWLATWTADYPDANNWIYDVLHCQYGYIRTGRECEAGDAYLDSAAVEFDLAERTKLYTQAEEHFFGPNGTFPVIPLFISTAARLQQPWLSGVSNAGSARYDLWTVDTAAQAGN